MWLRRRDLLRWSFLAGLAAACGPLQTGEDAEVADGRDIAIRSEVPSPEPRLVSPGQTGQATREATAPVAEIEVICREALGLSEPAPDDRVHELRGLMLHHTAVPSQSAAQAPERLRGHANFHREQGWPDIAYHYGVDLAGNVYELRDPGLPGDTFTAYDTSGWLLIVCEGNFDETPPSDDMLGGVSQVLAYGHERYGVPLESLVGHRDESAGVSCPGDHLYAALAELRGSAERFVREGGVSATELCGEAGRRRIETITSSA